MCTHTLLVAKEIVKNKENEENLAKETDEVAAHSINTEAEFCYFSVHWISFVRCWFLLLLCIVYARIM